MRIFKRVLALILVMLMVLPSFVTALAETVSVDGVTLNRASSYLSVGDTINLIATVTPIGATDTSVTWSSSDETVATVENGLVTAVAEGKATITATTTDGGFEVSSKVVVSKVDIRNHVMVQNPESDFRSLFTAENFEVYLPFEDNLTDKTGNTTATATGSLKYADGYYGKAAQFVPNSGNVSPYVDISGIELGTEPTTIAFWFKKESVTATEQNWIMNSYSSGTDGFRIYATDYVTNPDILSFVVNGTALHTRQSSGLLPADTYNGWSHIAYVKDKTTIQVYIDFKLVNTHTNKNFENITLAGDLGLRLGNDADGTYYDYRGLMDDFFVYNGAMSADDLTELGKYYGIGIPTVNLEGISLDKNEVYAVVGDTVELNASFTPANATFKALEWSTSDDSVVIVENGVVTMLAEGKATITATAIDGGFTAKCNVFVNSVVSPREHTSTFAPKVTGGVEFTNLFDTNKFRVYLPFENNAANMSDGDCTPVVKDDQYYGLEYDNGYYGRAARFDNGYIELNTDISTESVTIGTWVKADKINTSNIISNCGKESSDGFDVKLVNSVKETVNNSNATLYAKDGDNEFWVTARQDKDRIPQDAFDGWMHIAYTIDRKANQIILYCDFKETYRLAIKPGFSLENEVYDIVLGRPADANETTRFFGLMDDFFIYDDVLSADDMLTLRDYYGLGAKYSVKSISLNKTVVNLDINGGEQLIATILPEKAVNREIEWTTSNPEVATVKEGKITANATGTATITAKTTDGGCMATCTVNVSENTTRYIYDHVVIFGIDGAGTFFKDASTPNVDRIFGDYATTYDGLTNNPSISLQSWATILNGSLPEYHKRNNSNTLYEAYPEDSPYPSIFRLAREHFPTSDLATFEEKVAIYKGDIERNVGVTWEGGGPEEITGKALDYLNGKEDGRPPKVMFFYTAEPDHAGHAGGYGAQFPEYLNAITTADSNIGPVYDWYVENGYADNTLFIVCTDHGGTPVASGGSHGQLSDAEMYVFAGVSGRTVMKDSEIQSFENRDVAAIAAYALGMEIPETWSARVPDGVFADVNGMERNEVPYISSPIRNHVTEPTPALDGGEHLTDVFDEEKFNILAEFDGNINDTTGNHATTQVGTITYEDGYFGQGANFSEGGYITSDDCHVTTESFTIGFWLKYDELDYTEDMKRNAVICSTYDVDKYWATPGFAIVAKEEHNLGFKQTRTGMYISSGTTNPTVWKQLENWYFPDYDNKWVHYAFTYDRVAKKLTQYVDFKFHYTEPVSITDSNDLTNISLIIGQNTMLNKGALDASLDDFFIYKEAMTTDDIAKLASYYGADKEAYVESITLSETSAELNAGDTLTLTATVLPEDAMVKNVTWTSSDEAVATVENGVVIARKGGNVTITATTVDGGFTAECDITVTGNIDDTPDAAFIGSSLVLDGKIGVKVYVDIDEADVDRVALKVTTVNSDYTCTEISPNYSSLYRVDSVLTPIKDEATGKYYLILYVAAKDIDNVSFETELVIYAKSDIDTPVSVATANFNVESYIAVAKALAEAGEEAFVEALPLVESLETYGKYAENYFNKGSLADYRTKAESITFASPDRIGSITGVCFYATSLILEEDVVIRHYFKVTDIDAFNAAHTCDIEYGTKGGYIYFDIEDINAQSIGVPQTLTINNKDGSVAFTVDYSVGNYLANMLDSNDARIVSLVNAMYDYYIEAYTYNGSNELVSDKDETLADNW